MFSRQFLDSVTTDIVELKEKSLHYFSGNYSEWLLHEVEVAARNVCRVDAQTRKEDHVKKSIEMAKARGHDNVAKAKVKKLERASMNKRLDGKKFHTCSLKKLV
jgi:ATP-binding cassette subfamily F protein 3